MYAVLTVLNACKTMSDWTITKMENKPTTVYVERKFRRHVTQLVTTHTQRLALTIQHPQLYIHPQAYKGVHHV